MLLTELPAYLYWNAELPRKGDGALFHYTSLESFKKIFNQLLIQSTTPDKKRELSV